MALHDSMKRKEAPVVQLGTSPTADDLAGALKNAMAHSGKPVTLKWSGSEGPHILLITGGFGPTRSDVLWVLRAGEENSTSRLVWRHQTTDPSEIHMMLSGPGDNGGVRAVIPEELRPQSPVQQGEVTQALPQSKTAVDWQADAIPIRIADKYEIVELVGKGMMGSVYKARQMPIERIVALKVMHPHLTADELNRRRFEQEAKVTSTFSHPNLTLVYDFGFFGENQPYIVMEFVNGVSFQSELKSRPWLPLSQFIEVFFQICDGLCHAHSKGIIHRDLKPGNIMLVNEGGSTTVKIMDFGIAKMSSMETTQQELTQTGAVLGSPLYMSPEQCRGVRIDSRSDIYALGCMMYLSMTGVHPFQGDDVYSTMYKHITEQPPPFAPRRPDLSVGEPLERIILKALEKDPNDRYQHVKELQRDIAELQSAPGRQTSEKTLALSAESLLKEAGIVSQDQLRMAETLQERIGGEVLAYMVMGGSIDTVMHDAAVRCLNRLMDGTLDRARCVKLLQHCRNRQVGYDQAMLDLGWSVP